MDKYRISRLKLLLLLQMFVVVRISSSEELSNTSDLSELVDVFENLQPSAEKQTEPNNRVISIDQLTPADSTFDTRIRPSWSDIFSDYVDGVDIQTDSDGKGHIKSKRGWEELQRSWRSYFPKRAWDVVRSYWQRPHFRSAYKERYGKRNTENLVHVPVQPGNDNDQWMIDEVGYKVDENDKIVPDMVPSSKLNNEKRQWNNGFLSKNDHPLKRGWEDIRLFHHGLPGKRGWEDIKLFANRHPWKRGLDENLDSQTSEKRGWEDIGLLHGNRNFGKRGWEDIGLLHGNRNLRKRGWEDIGLLHGNRNFGKRGWEDIGLLHGNPNFGKRGWEDVRLFINAPVGNHGLNAFRYTPNARRGKRGPGEADFTQDTLSEQRNSDDGTVSKTDRLDKRGWEDVRLFRNGRTGKRGWEDIRLFEGCGCCTSVASLHCCWPCRSNKRAPRGVQYYDKDRFRRIKALMLG